VPVTVWLAPSRLTVTGVGQLAIPDKVSSQVKLMMTSVLFQPLALEIGLIAGVITGAVLSRLIVTDVVWLLPASSVAVPVISWFAPSVVTVTGDVQSVIFDVRETLINSLNLR